MAVMWFFRFKQSEILFVLFVSIIASAAIVVVGKIFPEKPPQKKAEDFFIEQGRQNNLVKISTWCGYAMVSLAAVFVWLVR